MQCHLWKSVSLQSLYTVKSLVFSTNRSSACILHAYRTYIKPMLAFCRSLHNMMSSCMHVCFFRLCLHTSCSSSTGWACLLSSLVSLAFATVIDYTLTWIIQDVQTFLLIQKFSFKCLMTHETSFKNFKFLKCTLTLTLTHTLANTHTHTHTNTRTHSHSHTHVYLVDPLQPVAHYPATIGLIIII